MTPNSSYRPSKSSSDKAKAAFHSLFEPSAPPELPEPVTVVAPSNLDDFILADHLTGLIPELYRWYRGTDAHGVLRTFRFQRGGAPEQWVALLRSQSLCTVEGPFKSRLLAVQP